MSWHFEVLLLTARRFTPGKSYANRDKFAAVATVQILGGKKAYISGFLADGTIAPIRKRDWIELGVMLWEAFGIEVVDSERHGEEKAFDTRPAPL